jgi:hypothetical protein
LGADLIGARRAPLALICCVARATVHYHGDFDWPGVPIARRTFDRRVLAA